MEIDEQKLREILAEQQEETKRYLGALREETAHQIEAVAEQYQGLSEKVDTVITAVGELNEKVEHTNARLFGVENKVQGIEGNLKEVKETLEEVSRVTDATFEQVGELVVAQTETQEILKNHEQRISVLER